MHFGFVQFVEVVPFVFCADARVDEREPEAHIALCTAGSAEVAIADFSGTFEQRVHVRYAATTLSFLCGKDVVQHFEGLAESVVGNGIYHIRLVIVGDFEFRGPDPDGFVADGNRV